MATKRTPTCPYCDHAFTTVPADRHPCPSCNQTIYIYSSHLDARVVLMTEEGLSKVIRPKSSASQSDYFTARMLELDAAFSKAKASTTHYGELGRELESLVKGLLEEYLPNKYRVATGFVRSLEKPGWLSNQIDLLLCRSDICYPIAIHQQYSVFPIESVVSFMEVTSHLTTGKLVEDYEKVAELQRLNDRVYYVPDPPESIRPYIASENSVRPRFYYFAFSTDLSLEHISKTMLELSNEYGVQLHALYILKPSQSWFMPNGDPSLVPSYQRIQTETRPREAIVSFLQHILISLQTADFVPPNGSLPFGRYFEEG